MKNRRLKQTKEEAQSLVIVTYFDVQVSEARKRKNRRLKQAKEEAQAEIEKYKQERERAFK